MHYLLDTSAIICFYGFKKEYEEFCRVINDERNTIHILEICIPEVISIFYKKHFAEKEITLEETRDLCSIFIDDIKSKIKFLIHPVMARDIIETDKIWEEAEKVYESKLKNTGKDFIDSTDALILALAINLSKTKGINNDFLLVTNDTHLFDTAEALKINVKRPNQIK